MNWIEILKSKTAWTALAGAITAVLGAFGTITPDQTKAIETVCLFLALIFMRVGVQKSGPEKPENP